MQGIHINSYYILEWNVTSLPKKVKMNLANLIGTSFKL